MIIEENGQLHLRIDYTPETVLWLYQKTLEGRTHNLGTRPFAPYVGKGLYTCVVNQQGDREVYIKSYKKDTPDYTPLSPELPAVWDMSKIPSDKYPDIKKMVKNKEWKKLVATVHNRYRLSSNNYCCDMADVAENFTKFVNGL